VLLSLVQGFSVLLIVGGVYATSFLRGHDDMQARALAYTALIVANVCLILTNRSWSRSILANLRTPNTALWWVLGGAAVFMTLALAVPFLRGVFRFAVLHPLDIVISLAAGIVSIAWLDLLKRRI
jgi:Ca2+-transporting ATPase